MKALRRPVGRWFFALFVALTVPVRPEAAEQTAPEASPVRFDLCLTRLDVDVVRAVMNGLDRNDLGIDRLFVPVLAEGQTSFPTDSAVFSPHPAFADQDLLGTILDKAHERGLKVYGALDCLCWAKPGTPPAQTPFAARPDLQELNRGRVCGGVEANRYASPFHPEVAAALTDLVRETAAKYPLLDGLLLECRLSTQEYLAYSDAARVAFIRAQHRDPLDLSFYPRDEKGREVLFGFICWRLEAVSSLIGQLSAAFREVNPHGQVAAKGFASLYRGQTGQQYAPAEDWLKWIDSGSIDELLLEEKWETPENENTLALAIDLIRKTDQPCVASPLVAAWREGDRVDYTKPLSALRAQGEVERVVLAVASAEELAQARQVIATLRAGAEDPLARAAREDPRLAEGWRLFQARQYEAAAAVYQQAQEKGSAAAWALYALGRVRQEQGKNAEALTAYQQALEVDPKHLPTLQAAAELQLAAGQPEAALPLLQTALEINPTGSTDRSVEIARELGARVLFQEFRDDFSEVRNASLRAATGDWLLVLDADERIEADQLPQLKRLLARLDQEPPVAYTFTVPDYYAEGRRYTLTVCRLFRNRPDPYFTGRVYESVWESLQALGETWADSGVTIRHLNYRKPLAASLRKDLLYQRLRVGEEGAAWKVLAAGSLTGSGSLPGVDGDELAAVVQSASEGGAGGVGVSPNGAHARGEGGMAGGAGGPARESGCVAGGSGDPARIGGSGLVGWRAGTTAPGEGPGDRLDAHGGRGSPPCEGGDGG